MARARRIDPFFLVVTARDKNVFKIEGPMVDDRRWNSAVCRAQGAGRKVHCHTAGSTNREEIAFQMRRTFGLRLLESGSIIVPGLDE